MRPEGEPQGDDGGSGGRGGGDGGGGGGGDDCLQLIHHVHQWGQKRQAQWQQQQE